MSKETIKIEKIARKEMPSKFREGEIYQLTTVMDEKGRKMSATGQWAENWKAGDEVEVELDKQVRKDKDGFDVEYLNLKNPNAKPFTPRGGGPLSNPTTEAYKIAAQLAPLLFASKKVVKFEDIINLAEIIKTKLESTGSSPTSEQKKDSTPEIKLDDDKDTSSKDTSTDDDEDPF